MKKHTIKEINNMVSNKKEKIVKSLLDDSINVHTASYTAVLKNAYQVIKRDGWKESSELTYEELGRVTGYSTNQIGNILNGKSRDLLALIKVMLALGIEPEISIAILKSYGYIFDHQYLRDCILYNLLLYHYEEPYSDINEFLEYFGKNIKS